MTPSLTPSPIPIDQLPPEFEQHLGWFFTDLFGAMRNIEIPFTSVTVYQVFLGCIVVGAVSLAVRLLYGNSGGKHHE